MKKIVIASTSQNAGKTSLIVGLARAKSCKAAYLKPLGDRLFYRKKRQWDHDAAVATGLLKLDEDPENMTVGFEHSKLKFMYDEEGIKEKLAEIADAVDKNRDTLFIEGGRNLTYGISVHMDSPSLAKYLDAKLVVVVSGSNDSIVDDVTFIKQYIGSLDVDFGGVIVNKIRDIDDFSQTHLAEIEELGINIYGIIPFQKELTYFSADYVSEKLFAKMVAGENGIGNTIKNIVVGAMSADAAVNTPVFKSENKLVITGGDRSDMILAALETNSSAIVITNNILPPSNIISKATELGIPLMMVKDDTFVTAKRIDEMEPLMTKTDEERANMLAELVGKYVKVDEIC